MVSSVAIAVPLGVVGGLLGLWHGLTYYEVDMKCEKPKYSVMRTLGSKKNWYGKTVPKAEIRRYSAYLVAQVTASPESGSMRDALGQGFRQIAGFIFGKNVAADGESSKVAMTSPVTLEVEPKSEKIAMTSPVAAESVGDNTYKVAFIMPSKYTKETLPKPLNDDVKILEVPAHTMAALTFRGASPSEEKMAATAEELRQLCKENRVEVKGNVHLYQYHPPFAPSWMRINEVLFEVVDKENDGDVM